MVLRENLKSAVYLFPVYFFHHVTAGEVNSWDILLEALEKLSHIDYESTHNLSRGLLEEASDAVKIAEHTCKH